MEPGHREEYIAYLNKNKQWSQAAKELATCVNDDTFRSIEGKSKHSLWLELCDIVTKHPDEVQHLDIDAIIRGGIRKFTNEVCPSLHQLPALRMRSACQYMPIPVFVCVAAHGDTVCVYCCCLAREALCQQYGAVCCLQGRHLGGAGEHSQRQRVQVGRLWCALADYYIRQGLFERARDVYQEGVESVNTVRDFTLIFEALTSFEQALIETQMEQLGEDMPEEAGEAEGDGADFLLAYDKGDIELRLERLEWLYAERPKLLNSVMLRQNPHNVAVCAAPCTLALSFANLPDNGTAAQRHCPSSILLSCIG